MIEKLDVAIDQLKKMLSGRGDELQGRERWHALASMMSEVSEDHYCAGWLVDLEYELWEIITEKNRPFGFGYIDPGKLLAIASLARELGGWIVWQHNDDPEKSGERFVTFEEFEPMYEVNKEKVRLRMEAYKAEKESS